MTLPDADLEKFLQVHETMVRLYPESVKASVLPKLEAARQLRTAVNDGSDSDEVDRLRIVSDEPTNLVPILLREGVERAKGFTIRIALPVTLLVALVGLPVTAYFDAERVRDCHNSRVGFSGMSGFRGSTAKVWISRTTVTQQESFLRPD